MGELLYKLESYAIQGAIYEVYYQLGSGFLESVYQEAMEKEFKEREIPYVAQKRLEIIYKDKIMNQKFRIDFLCYDSIIVELKTASQLCAAHRAQVINYLKVTNKRLGILVNFQGYPKAEIERFVL